MTDKNPERTLDFYKPDCEHGRMALRRYTDKGGRACFVHQCQVCGRSSGQILYRLLGDIDTDAVPERDPTIWERRWAERLQETRDERLAYYETDEWRFKRRLVLARAGHVCEGCRVEPATQAHHLVYTHFRDEFLWELRAVCRDCHERYHHQGRYAE